MNQSAHPQYSIWDFSVVYSQFGALFYLFLNQNRRLSVGDKFYNYGKLYYWTHVSDFDGLAKEHYDIGPIPANFLLDRDGRIIEKNLRGARLEEVMVSLFPKLQ